MKKLLTVTMIIIFALALAACGAKESKEGAATPTPQSAETSSPEPSEAPEANDGPLEFTHKLGKTTVDKNPQKVVVFDFGTLDTLDKLGVEVIGLPKSNIPPYLADKYSDAKYENVGSLKEPDFEKINALKPDLIVITGRTSDSYEEMSKIGPTLYVEIDNSKYMESFEHNARLFGEIFGKEDVVEKELTEVKEAIKQLHDKASASGKNSLIILTNDNKISAYGPSSRFGIIHDVFGFAPVDDKIEVSTHGQSISFEYIVDKDPDYLFVVDRTAAVGGESGAKEMIENDLVKNTKAYKEGNIVYLDPNYWYLSGGGLISVPAMVKEVEASVK